MSLIEIFKGIVTEAAYIRDVANELGRFGHPVKPLIQIRTDIPVTEGITHISTRRSAKSPLLNAIRDIDGAIVSQKKGPQIVGRLAVYRYEDPATQRSGKLQRWAVEKVERRIGVASSIPFSILLVTEVNLARFDERPAIELIHQLLTETSVFKEQEDHWQRIGNEFFRHSVPILSEPIDMERFFSRSR